MTRKGRNAKPASTTTTRPWQSKSNGQWASPEKGDRPSDCSDWRASASTPTASASRQLETPHKQNIAFAIGGSRADKLETPEKHANNAGMSSSRRPASRAGNGPGKEVSKAENQRSPAEVHSTSGTSGGGGESTPTSKQAEAGVTLPRRPKEDVATEIEAALRRSGARLKSSDFDKLVRQTLHAIHGCKQGAQGVHDALLMVDFYTKKKKRDSVRNWPAYMSQLLRKYFESLKAEQRGSPLSMPRPSPGIGGACSSASAPVVATVNIPTRAETQASDHGTAYQSAKTSKQCPSSDSKFKVPDRVQVGQLMDRELHSEFICRVCLELCQDAITLPCSHLFCRECTRDLVGCKLNEGTVPCPACREPFEPSKLDFEAPMSRWLTRWINNMQVCCAFACPAKLPDPEDDPLPAGHAARSLGLQCDWVGPAAAYKDHICKECCVAPHLRELQLKNSVTPPAGVSESAVSGVQAGSASAASKLPADHGATSEAVSERVAKESHGGSDLEVPNLSQSSLKDIGDFTVVTRWSSDGDGVLTIEVGDHLYITKLDPSGWAQGTVLSSGRKGWFPPAFCQRRVHPVAMAAGADLSGYLHLKRGDDVIVYLRDMHGWAYGATLRSDRSPGAPGWFPEKALGGA